MIDVSQSVEHDHPRTYDFLRNDIRNVNDYFTRQSVRTLGSRRTWDFIIAEALDGMKREEELGEEGEQKVMAIARAWIENDDENLEKDFLVSTHGPDDEVASEESRLRAAGDEAVFMSSFIPRSLAELSDPERNVELLRCDTADQLIYSALSGAEGSIAQASTTTPEAASYQTGEDLPRQLRKIVRFDGEDEQGGLTDEEEAGEEIKDRRPRGFRHEDKEAKRVSRIFDIEIPAQIP